MSLYFCPQCRSAKVVRGAVIGMSGGNTVWFAPHGLHVVGLPGAGVPLSTGLCCISCGLLWTHAEPERVRAAVEKYGSALAKELLTTIETGRYQGLPDIPEARRAADGVFEIDELIVEGRKPAATRRYRELTHTTWDGAIDAVRHWAELTRKQKLALFGWQPKEGPVPGAAEAYNHPMRDSLLDG